MKPLAGVCIVAALLGLVLDLQPWSENATSAGSVLGYVYAFGSSIAAGFSYTSLRALADISSATTLMAMYGFSLTASFITLLITGTERVSNSVLLHFVGISVVTYLSELLITKGYALATQGAGSVAVYKFLTPIFALAFDVAFFGEIPNVSNIAGALVVVGSSALMVHVQAKADPVQPHSKRGGMETSGVADGSSSDTASGSESEASISVPEGDAVV